MSNQIRESEFDEWRRAFLAALKDGVSHIADSIRSIERASNGKMPVTGAALEMAPWHGWFSFSLRESNDFPLGESCYDSAGWPHFDLFGECWERVDTIAKARSLLSEVYGRADNGPHSRIELSHLLFLAGAEALLDRDFAKLLRSFDIEAPVVNDSFESHFFEYIVIDPDQSMKSNYCDVVVANRVTKRLMGTVV